MYLFKIISLFFITIILSAQSLNLKNDSNQYDYVIITVQKFHDQCEVFAEYKANSHKMRTLVVTTHEIINEFDDNEELNENIREFISYAGTNWRNPLPKYFFIVGNTNQIPNFTQSIFTEYNDTARTDYYYGLNKYEDDDYLDFNIGRIAVSDTVQLQNYFNKVIKYEYSEFQDWQRNITFVVDDGNCAGQPRVGNFFEQQVINFTEDLPEHLNPKIIFQSDTSEYYGNIDSISGYVNDPGTSILIFTGFGNDSLFTCENLLSIDNVDRLTNSNKPFFVSFLHKQAYSTNNSSSITDELLFSENGAIGAFNTIGLNYAHSSFSIQKEFYENLFESNNKSIGDIWREILNEPYNVNTKDRYNIIGDPSLAIRVKLIANITEEHPVLVKNYHLHQNYPNPFNPTTTIKYAIPSNVKSEPPNIKLRVFDILGNEVATLVNETKTPGIYELEFDASGLSSGVYLYKLDVAGNISAVRKMLLIK